MTIGVAAVIVLVAVGNGSKQQVQARIDALGSNVLSSRPRTAPAARAAALRRRRRADARRPQDADGAAGRVQRARRQDARSPVVNATGTTLVARLDELLSRRSFVGTTPAVRHDARLPRSPPARCSPTPGRQEAPRAWSSSARPSSRTSSPAQDPVGQTVRVDGTSFQVVGVTEPKGSNGVQDQDDVVHRAAHRRAGRASAATASAQQRSPSRRRSAARSTPRRPR